MLAFGGFLPQKSLAIDPETMKAISDFEWDNPIRTGDVLMYAFGFFFVFLAGNVIGKVIESDKNFNEIIDIINEAIIIKGTDDENPNFDWSELSGDEDLSID